VLDLASPEVQKLLSIWIEIARVSNRINDFSHFTHQVSTPMSTAICMAELLEEKLHTLSKNIEAGETEKARAISSSTGDICTIIVRKVSATSDLLLSYVNQAEVVQKSGFSPRPIAQVTADASQQVLRLKHCSVVVDIPESIHIQGPSNVFAQIVACLFVVSAQFDRGPTPTGAPKSIRLSLLGDKAAEELTILYADADVDWGHLAHRDTALKNPLTRLAGVAFAMAAEATKNLGGAIHASPDQGLVGAALMLRIPKKCP
jgi:hypothetical protein